MHGGIGRYTHNLVKSLKANGGMDVMVVSNSDSSADYHGLSPFNKENNSKVLHKLVKETKPDVIHIQHEHGLYGFHLHPIFPWLTKTGIDEFYSIAQIPIVTTFHTAYNFSTWMQSILIDGKDSTRLKYLNKFWKHLINYGAFRRTIDHASSKSSAKIVLSKYMATLIPDSHVVYHGAEPFQSMEVSQMDARKNLGLPEEGKILLVQGFLTATKGWNIIRKMELPKDWKIVINYSKNYYNKQIIDLKLNPEKENKNIINLNKDYLSEHDLSLLFFASDIVFVPYKAISGSGTMFDGLGHGKPFLSSNVGFFKEFAEMNLGICAERTPKGFEQGLRIADKCYDELKACVKEFKELLKWNNIAQQHIRIYENVLSRVEKKEEEEEEMQAYMQSAELLNSKVSDINNKTLSKESYFKE